VRQPSHYGDDSDTCVSPHDQLVAVFVAISPFRLTNHRRAKTSISVSDATRLKTRLNGLRSLLADSTVTRSLRSVGWQLGVVRERDEDWNVTWVKESIPD